MGDAFFNPATGVGFIVFSNGDDQHDDQKGMYDDALAAIEKKLMETYDVNGGWPKTNQVTSGTGTGTNNIYAKTDQGQEGQGRRQAHHNHHRRTRPRRYSDAKRARLQR